MNIDFHYYVTYLAARTAGYKKEDAQTIAYAAQYVDESTKDMIKEELLPGLMETTPTIESNSKILRRNFDLIFENREIEQSELIWRSFHFLPGNVHPNDNKVAYMGAKRIEIDTEWGVDYLIYGEKEQRAFSLMCQPNSVLSEKMVNNIVENKGKAYYLELLGICMHVLADTWAHRYFAGTPSMWVNDAPQDVYDSSNHKRMDFPIIKDWSNLLAYNYYLATPAMPSLRSFAYLGHGRMGGVPDVPYMQYYYIPRWNNVNVEKNNPEEYMLAFRQMVHAMVCVRKGYWYEKDTYEDISDDLANELTNAFMNKEYDPNQAEQFWKPIIKKIYPGEEEELPKFVKEQWKKDAETAEEKKQTHYYYFNCAALVHQKFVTRYLDDIEQCKKQPKERKEIEETDYVMLCRVDGDEERQFASTQIQYLAHDHREWSAEYKKGRFYLYRKGQKRKIYTSAYLDFLGDQEEKYRAIIEEGVFKIRKLSEEGEAETVPELKYMSWNKKMHLVSLVTWENVDYTYLNGDFREFRMRLFAFKRQGEERFSSISPRVPYLYKDGIGENDKAVRNIFEFIYLPDMEPKENFRVNTKGKAPINAILPWIPFSVDENYLDTMEIRGNKFLINGEERDSVEVMDCDNNNNYSVTEVTIIDWCDS